MLLRRASELMPVWSGGAAYKGLLSGWRSRRPSPRPPREKGCGARRALQQHEPRAPPRPSGTIFAQKNNRSGARWPEPRGEKIASRTLSDANNWSKVNNGLRKSRVCANSSIRIPEAPLFGLLDGRDGRVLAALFYGN